MGVLVASDGEEVRCLGRGGAGGKAVQDFLVDGSCSGIVLQAQIG